MGAHSPIFNVSDDAENNTASLSRGAVSVKGTMPKITPSLTSDTSSINASDVSEYAVRRVLKLHDNEHKVYAVITGITDVEKIISGDYI